MDRHAFGRSWAVCRKLRNIAVTLLMVAGGLSAGTADTPSQPSDLTNATIEELMQIEVTSVAKKEQKLNRVPAAET